MKSAVNIKSLGNKSEIVIKGGRAASQERSGNERDDLDLYQSLPIISSDIKLNL